jgi:hypothetical protein
MFDINHKLVMLPISDLEHGFYIQTERGQRLIYIEIRLHRKVLKHELVNASARSTGSRNLPGVDAEVSVQDQIKLLGYNLLCSYNLVDLRNQGPKERCSPKEKKNAIHLLRATYKKT